MVQIDTILINREQKCNTSNNAVYLRKIAVSFPLSFLIFTHTQTTKIELSTLTTVQISLELNFVILST